MTRMDICAINSSLEFCNQRRRQQANRDASGYFRFLDDGAAFAGSAHAAGGIVRVSADNDMIVMHFEQRSDKRPVAITI